MLIGEGTHQRRYSVEPGLHGRAPAPLAGYDNVSLFARGNHDRLQHAVLLDRSGEFLKRSVVKMPARLVGVGCYLGGIASDRLVNRTGDARWHMRIPAICTLLTVPMLFGVYLSPTPLPSLLLSAAVWFLGNTWLGPVQATIAGLAGTRRRGMALAFLLFVNNLVGLGLGPQAVGILSDALHPSYGVDALRYALLGTLVIASLLSALFFFRAGRTLREDLEAAQA